MAKPQEDRRVRRTRALLQNALMASMIEKGYEATTVQDIIDRADVGRSTFYTHFADKQTLLASRLDDLRDALSREQQLALAARGGAGARGLGFSLPMLEHVRSHEPGLARWQDRCTPLSRTVGGGCHLNRDTRQNVEAAGFTFEAVEEEPETRIGIALFRPHLQAVARAETAPPR